MTQRPDAPRVVIIHFSGLAPEGLPRYHEPFTVGVPLPRGLETGTDNWQIVESTGQPLPLQSGVLERWSDGSIRWALLDFQADVTATSARVELRLDGSASTAAGSTSLMVEVREASSLVVSTGVGRFAFRRGSAAVIEATDVGQIRSAGTTTALRIVSENGQPASVLWTDAQGRVRPCVRVDGHARLANGARLELIVRVHLYAGSAVARILLTIRNPRRAAHPDGFWELGDAGSVLVKEASLVVRAPEGARLRGVHCSFEEGKPPEQYSESVRVYQDSSGGENWRSPNHVNRAGIVPNQFRGYRATCDGLRRDGLRATPVVVVDTDAGMLGAAVPKFWQNFPRAVEGTAMGVTVSFWPPDYADLHELQGGEQKTHEVWLSFGPDSVTDLPLDWCRARTLVHLTPEWYAEANAAPCLAPQRADSNEQYQALVNAAIEGENTFLNKRERIDEYGWRNFGDIYADHEAVNAPAGQSFVSHYNNQYDAVGGFAVHFMRSADPRWWTQMDELARHMVDIDIYHTDEDKSAYNHGLFWHTAHYVDGRRSSHRTYPRTAGAGGGGPSNEHNYTTGLLYHHFLTGDASSRETVVELARWVLDMDDGRRTVFRWLDRGDTGLASSTGSTLYHGPGRGAANSILTLLNAHALTGEIRYLVKAEQLIRRCIHPASDIAALNLLDAERRWYYTVFLQAIGRYLHYKADSEQQDAMYSYARSALLHYARWMVPHEYPYLDKPEDLEFPNETWAAQDMRKSEVFDFAMLHSAGEERERFRERGAFFFDYATHTLLSMKTHTLTRPIVLMLSNGWKHAHVVQCSDASLPAPTIQETDFGRPEAFIPQKVRAMRRAALIAAAMVCLLGVGAAGLFALLR
jgi:hypothetical protein